jgi:iron complex outermembrane receptor protein
LSIDGKYVGKQYLDSTMSEGSKVPAYFISNLSLSHEFDLNHGILGLSAYVNNLFNNLYYADGWAWNVYNVDTGRMESSPGIYPQSPLNFMLKATYSF